MDQQTSKKNFANVADLARDKKADIHNVEDVAWGRIEWLAQSSLSTLSFRSEFIDNSIYSILERWHAEIDYKT